MVEWEGTVLRVDSSMETDEVIKMKVKEDDEEFQQLNTGQNGMS